MFTTKGKREPHVSEVSTLGKTDSQRDGLACARARILIVFSISYLGEN